MDLDKEFAMVLERISRQADLMYLHALARIYKVHFETVLIWRATGRA
ncbi:hypothetical protein SEA_QUADZERO_41 [Microbacterium phage QuadZero]|nr:hypothetical protein SEA_QUADZERO_41 [Microbacterium phage QuadZero]